MVEDQAEFRVLGPLDVRYRGSSVLPAPRLRGPLSLLALYCGQVVADDRLRADSFGTAGLNAYRTAMSRLRTWLAGIETTLAYAAGGYSLAIDPDAVDAGRFRRLLRECAQAPDEVRLARLAEAVNLWRGTVLAGAPEWLTADPVAAALHRDRLAAGVLLGDVALRLGDPQAALPCLAQLCDGAPFDEPLQAAYIRLLTAAGRPAEALRHYGIVRLRLRDELGASPDERLQRAYAEILAGQRGVDPPGAGGPSWTVPRQLRADQADFVGRAADLRALDDLVRPGGIVTVNGLGGIGKTTLVVHWAHRAAERFADGQLHVDLRGVGPGEPASALEALGLLLRSIGHPPLSIPAEEAPAAELFRSLMSGRRALLVLDNAASAAQVRPLLPRSPTCAVIVTARRTLTGLVALDGARTHDLGVLAPADSLMLIARVVGMSRVDAEPEAATRLAALAGHLPLALRIAAASLSVEPRRPIADLVAALESGPLPGLAIADDPQASVREVFAHTYRTLDGRSRRLFRLLGVVPGPDVGEAAIAALAGAPAAQTLAALRRLVEAHLVVECRSGRYAMHDLVRAFAAERLAAEESGEHRAAAGVRLLRWYADHARSAAGAYAPGQPYLHREQWTLAPMPDPDEAGAWFESEVDCIAAAVGARPPLGDPADVCALADATRPFLIHVGHGFASWLALASAAAKAADTLADADAAVAAQLSLLDAYSVAGRYEEALAHGRTAFDAAAERGWSEMQWAIGGGIGKILNFVGRHEEAVRMCLAAATASQIAGNRTLAAQHLINVEFGLQNLGRLDEGEATLASLLADIGPLCSPRDQRVIRQNLAMIRHLLGRSDAALDLVTEVRQEIEESGTSDSYLHGCACDTEAQIRRDRGELALALDCSDKAVALMTGIQSSALAEMLNTRASIMRRLGRTAEAAAEDFRALGLARRYGSAQLEATSLLGLAESAAAAGDDFEAVQSAERALAIAGDRGLRIVAAEALDLLARTAAAAGDPARAAQCQSASKALLADSGYAAGERRH